MAPGKPQDPKLDEYTMMVIRATVNQAWAEHQQNCTAYREFFGDGTKDNPGIKTIVDRHETRIGTLETCKRGIVNFTRDKLAAPVIVAVVVALFMGWMNGRKIEQVMEKEKAPDPAASKSAAPAGPTRGP